MCVFQSVCVTGFVCLSGFACSCVRCVFVCVFQSVCVTGFVCLSGFACSCVCVWVRVPVDMVGACVSMRRCICIFYLFIFPSFSCDPS